MKKIILFAFFSLVFLAGCNGAAPVANDIDKVVNWVKDNAPTTHIEESYVFPTTHPELGGTITWESLDPDVITSDGVVTLETGTKETILTYTVTLDGITRTENLIVTVSSLSIERVAAMFADQFKAYILSDSDVNTDFGEGYEVTWSSSNESVFTNEGKYIKPINDVLITISYTVTHNGMVENGTKEVNVKGIPFYEKEEEIRGWLVENVITSRYIEEELELPLQYEKYGVDIHWSSSNSGVIDETGKVKQYAFDRYVTLTAKMNFNGNLSFIDFSLVIGAKEATTKEEKLNSLLEAIAVPEIGKVSFGSYGEINQSYNYIPFYYNTDAPVYDYIMPLGGSRPGTKLYSVEFITIHDTANPNSNALAHAKLLLNGYTASWHYAIDDKGAYNSVPLDEVAWHAGDGSSRFNLTDTGVRATTKYPVVTISSKGFYEFNGEVSSIKAPLFNEVFMPKTSDITPSGIYTEVINGYYYMNTSYYNKDYAKLSNGGGNRNSIGIETSVHNGNDYLLTLRHTAKLSAEILLANDLSVDRVLQHNNFSGKACPNAIRNISYWNEFLDLISLEKFAKKELSDVDFTWTSATTILDNTGKIALDIEGFDKVEYSVIATDGTTNVVKTYVTNLK